MKKHYGLGRGNGNGTGRSGGRGGRGGGEGSWKTGLSGLSDSKAFGIVPYLCDRGKMNALFQQSFSSDKLDLKIDPTRGKAKNETAWEAATRKCYEETCFSLDFRHLELSNENCLIQHNGTSVIFHIRVNASNEEYESLLTLYDDNWALMNSTMENNKFIETEGLAFLPIRRPRMFGNNDLNAQIDFFSGKGLPRLARETRNILDFINKSENYENLHSKAILQLNRRKTCPLGSEGYIVTKCPEFKSSELHREMLSRPSELKLSSHRIADLTSDQMEDLQNRRLAVWWNLYPEKPEQIRLKFRNNPKRLQKIEMLANPTRCSPADPTDDVPEKGVASRIFPADPGYIVTDEELTSQHALEDDLLARMATLHLSATPLNTLAHPSSDDIAEKREALLFTPADDSLIDNTVEDGASLITLVDASSHVISESEKGEKVALRLAPIDLSGDKAVDKGSTQSA